MTWTHAGDTTSIPLTEHQTIAVEDVLDAAQEWACDALPIEQAMTIGDLVSTESGLPSPAFTRFMAMHYTRGTSDPRRADLLRMIDAILSHRHRVVTEWGVFDRKEIERHDQGFDAELVQNHRADY